LIRAVYPGSFDPITNGHIYIAERAAALFDELIVAVLHNPSKRSTFSVEERRIMAREAFSHLPNLSVESFEGLLVDFMRQRRSRVILRGLRALSDFEYEFQMALINRRLNRDIETVFLMTGYKWFYTSSNLIKEAAGHGGSVRGLVPEVVLQRLQEKYPTPSARR